jgi:transposase
MRSPTQLLARHGTIVIRIELTDADARRLEQAFLQATDRKHRDRLQIVRLAHRGRAHRDIAADLGLTTRTVPTWLNAYLKGGIAALKPRKAKGQPSAIPTHLARDIRRWVIDGPAGQGLDRANWTHAELADHLRKTHGIAASRSAMQRFCRSHGIRPYRPTYRLLRGDPVKQAEAKVELAELRAKARALKLEYYVC